MKRISLVFAYLIVSLSCLAQNNQNADKQVGTISASYFIPGEDYFSVYRIEYDEAEAHAFSIGYISQWKLGNSNAYFGTGIEYQCLNYKYIDDIWSDWGEYDDCKDVDNIFVLPLQISYRLFPDKNKKFSFEPALSLMCGLDSYKRHETHYDKHGNEDGTDDDSDSFAMIGARIGAKINFNKIFLGFDGQISNGVTGACVKLGFNF